jgi:hypothetical protein
MPAPDDDEHDMNFLLSYLNFRKTSEESEAKRKQRELLAAFSEVGAILIFQNQVSYLSAQRAIRLAKPTAARGLWYGVINIFLCCCSGCFFPSSRVSAILLPMT